MKLKDIGAQHTDYITLNLQDEKNRYTDNIGINFPVYRYRKFLIPNSPKDNAFDRSMFIDNIYFKIYSMTTLSGWFCHCLCHLSFLEYKAPKVTQEIMT